MAAEIIRDIGNAADMPMTIGHYLRAMDKLTKQWTPTNFRGPKRQRLYMKDIDCPDAWHHHLKDIIPQLLFYLNDNIGDRAVSGELHGRNHYSQMAVNPDVAIAGDLMSNLPLEMRAQNMMCYIGHEGTYTPAHREMCATLGQNIMVETSENEKAEKPGSSIWFMTETKDREVVSEYFLSMLGHDIEVEAHFAQINAWKKAPFPVYIVEQKVGDLILVPPLAPHQVWNRGTRTMKVAWNRTTIETLELAIHEALPRARMVCRDEQYKVKAIIYYSLLHYHAQLKQVDDMKETSYIKEPIKPTPRLRQLQIHFKRLFALFTIILTSEMFSPDLPKEKKVEFLHFDSNVTCSYCRCNIFNRFLTCKTCIDQIEGTADEDTYDICMDCFAMGRSCCCISNLQWVEQWQWSTLTQKYEQWRAMIIAIDGYVNDKSPPNLDIARQRYGKKPVAQICQEQLRLRPWHDITKPFIPDPLPGDSDIEPETDDYGRLKKKASSKRKSTNLEKDRSCHICLHRELKWKLAFCTTCKLAYCYGTLWRAFDLKPQEIMEDPNWSCPKCQRICSCGRCRKDPRQIPYRPKGTLLGHDTRLVADPRSIESLVDFSRTNLGWLRGEGDDPQSSLRMQRLMEKAQTEKARDEVLEDDIATDVDSMRLHAGPLIEETSDTIAIDPQLCEASGVGEHVNSIFNDQRDGHAANHKPHTHHSEQSKHPDYISSINGDSSAQISTLLVPEHQYNGNDMVTRDCMMGMGYYEQGDDMDKILFDDPDASSNPTSSNPPITYPRLAEGGEQLGNSGRKRKRQNPQQHSSIEDEAYTQFLKAQKRQRLSVARKNGVFFITQNKLEGGRPLLVKLLLHNSKDFLQHIDNLEKGDEQPSKYNPRPARNNTKGFDPAEKSEDEVIIVRSDVHTNPAEFDAGDDAEEMASRNQVQHVDLSSTTKPQITAGWKAINGTGTSADVANERRSASSIASPGQNNPSRTASKSAVSTAINPTENESNRARRSPTISTTISPTENGTNRARRSPTISTTISPPEYKSKGARRSPAGLQRQNMRELGDLSANLSRSEPKDLRRITFFKKVVDELAGPSPSGYYNDLLMDNHEETSRQLPGTQTVDSASTRSSNVISKDYKHAKLAALRMADGKDDDSVGQTEPLRTKVSSKDLPTKIGPRVLPMVVARPAVTTQAGHLKRRLLLPPAPPGKLLSMAERRALAARKSKTDKAVSSEPAPVTSSSSDDDEGIPAIRPRPRGAGLNRFQQTSQ